jgi:hypothetical protein
VVEAAAEAEVVPESIAAAAAPEAEPAPAAEAPASDEA